MVVAVTRKSTKDTQRDAPEACGTTFDARKGHRVETEVITVRTGSRPTVVDLTRQAGAFVAGRGDGLLHVFVPHATAGLALIETGAGSDDDLLRALDDVLPADERWRHRHGSKGHGRDHVMPAFVPPSLSLPVVDGRIAL